MVNLEELVTHCHKPNCSWLALDSLKSLKDPPPLLPNPELSGIGVILGFSLTAYLTLALLILHYITVHDVRRKNPKGKEYINPVDNGILKFLRERIIAWTPSRRFEYAMEKSVLILSDTQLVTGLAILIAGYSQLHCGITAYHWQIMVFVAWFSSFTFLSAMSFLQGYFQTNNNLRLIRIFFMFILASLMIGALLPTGSEDWLDLYDSDTFYPSLSALCYYEQLPMKSFTRGGIKIWSMIFSIVVVTISYIHGGIRLFDPTSQITRNYFRTIPGSYVKQFLYFLERKVSPKGLRAAVWMMPYLLIFSVFTCARAFYDITESMLLEIIWLSFAIAWGTIKVWDTRSMATIYFEYFQAGNDPYEFAENSWSFGQTLPLVLLLLPVLSMTQAYLDNDAKAQEAVHVTQVTETQSKEKEGVKPQTAEFSGIHVADGTAGETPDPRSSTSCSITRCNHQPSLHFIRKQTSTANDEIPLSQSSTIGVSSPPPVPPRSPLRPLSPIQNRTSPDLPQYPYHRFTQYPWYNDQITLLLGQILMVSGFTLFMLQAWANFLGISAILRNRLFLIWILGMIPLGSFVHLGLWYVMACITCRWPDSEEWLKGEGKHRPARIEGARWQKITVGEYVYWSLRMLLVSGCLLFTFFLAFEIAGPDALIDYF